MPNGYIQVGHDDVDDEIESVPVWAKRMLALHIYHTIVLTIMFIIQLSLMIGIGVVVWTQYDRLEPYLSTGIQIANDIKTYAPMIEHVLTNVTSIVSQVDNVNYLVTGAAHAVPYVNQVWMQYQACAPLLHTFCTM